MGWRHCLKGGNLAVPSTAAVRQDVKDPDIDAVACRALLVQTSERLTALGNYLAAAVRIAAIESPSPARASSQELLWRAREQLGHTNALVRELRSCLTPGETPDRNAASYLRPCPPMGGGLEQPAHSGRRASSSANLEGAGAE